MREKHPSKYITGYDLFFLLIFIFCCIQDQIQLHQDLGYPVYETCSTLSTRKLVTVYWYITPLVFTEPEFQMNITKQQ